MNNNLKSKLEIAKYIVSILVGLSLVVLIIHFLVNSGKNEAEVYAEYTDITGSNVSTEDSIDALFKMRDDPEAYQQFLKDREDTYKAQKEYTESVRKESENQTVITNNNTTVGFEVHFIDVGQGDCTLIRCGNHAMVIDGGDNNVGTLIQKYLTDQGVSYLDYVVSTHGDADHCGSLDVIVTKFDCGTILTGAVRKHTRTEDDFYDAIEYRGYKYITPAAGATFSLGDAHCEVIGPIVYDVEDINDTSLVVKVTYNGRVFLFMGDAGEYEEQTILGAGLSDVKADVIKLGHHGSNTSSSEEFLRAVNPTSAVISCGLGNDYGHPHPSVLNYLQRNQIDTYRTDESGTIVVTVTGYQFRWNTSPSYTWKTGFDYQ